MPGRFQGLGMEVLQVTNVKKEIEDGSLVLVKIKEQNETSPDGVGPQKSFLQKGRNHKTQGKWNSLFET